MVEILTIFSFLYSSTILTFAFFVARAKYLPSLPGYRPTVTIVVAARNEEHNITACLDSIIQLSYPKHLLQVIVVDDQSTDRTSEIVQDYTTTFSWITLVHALPPDDHLRGKANALAQGIDHVVSEIVMLTDADCKVPREWVENTVRYYVDDRVGIVAGFTTLQGNSMFDHAQALDWLALLSVAAATTRMGSPVTAIGNNLSFRLEAYNSVGGYHRMPFSVTEDFMLVHSIVNYTPYRIVFPLDSSVVVESQPCSTWQQLYSQKKRWFLGALDMKRRHTLVVWGIALMNALIIVSFFSKEWRTGLIVLGLKAIVDLILLSPSLGTLSSWHLLKGYLAYQFYSTISILVFPLSALTSRTIVWKARNLEK